MKDHFSNFVSLFVCHIGGLMAGFLSVLILLTPIRMLTMDYQVRAAVSFLMQDAVIFAFLYILYRRTGYSWNRSGESLLPRWVLISLCISPFLVFAVILFSRLQWIFLYFNSSCVIDFLYANLEGSASNGMIGLVKLREEYFVQTILVVFVHTVLYSIPAILGYYYGAKKRSAERAATIHHT